MPVQTGYQVFLGPKQYFVSSDVGNGQQQYYAFLDVPPGGDDKWAKCEEWDNYRDMLLDRFGDWCPAVLERLHCTRPEDVERRDVNDLAPDPRWVDGSVALLGDACHAVQPNLGQGGGQVRTTPPRYCPKPGTFHCLGAHLTTFHVYDLV